MIIIYDYLKHPLKLSAFLSCNWRYRFINLTPGVESNLLTIVAGGAKQAGMEDE
jgi:hypothetical protein